MALRLGHWDVDALQDAMTPEQFDLWIAYLAIEGDPYLRIVEVLKNGLAAVANAWGRGITPDMLDPWHEAPEGAEAATADDLTAIGL